MNNLNQLMGGLYSFAHAGNEIAGYIYECTKATYQGDRMTSYPAEQRAELRLADLMAAVVEMGQWWDKVKESEE